MSEPTPEERIKKINDDWEFLEGVHESEGLVEELVEVTSAAVEAERERLAEVGAAEAMALFREAWDAVDGPDLTTRCALEDLPAWGARMRAAIRKEVKP